MTGYRPSDHRWHKGLQMTSSHLSGQNFWGGNSYVHGEGYLRFSYANSVENICEAMRRIRSCLSEAKVAARSTA